LVKQKRRWIAVIVGLVVLALLYKTLYSGIQLVTSIPTVFQGQNIQYKYENGFTFLKSEQEHVNNPITHDDEALYILNGATDEFKKFYVDSTAGELVVKQNIVSPKKRSGPYFQVVKVPTSKYKPVVHNGKVKVRIQYLYLGNQSTLLEYDLNSRKTNLISHTLVGK
jgi:hypothetical protein